ncbi:ATP-dependent DNA helicase RecQ [Marinomonas aquimarina]|uniref:ATP-dependent DNA helicase RecQ n=1 Tax=Marinomonas aquimarina TaxID=295068 RepID=A0A1A8TIR9_9GAMM|nr:ATP-dependent DNA helicase RecQ [Marinomonas aquimarina]SBS32060.1 ATP-dependent DNA helicase RecQ [Marinomonas aquimarina]
MSKPIKIDSVALDNAYRALQRLGYQDYIGSQQICVESLLQGNDVLALLPTGAGKSAIYQVASLARQGVGLVVSPLIAIMQQQVQQLQQLGIKAEFLNSTQNGAEQNDLYWRLRHGDVEILYMSPEKLLQSSVIGLLEDIDVSCIAIDEAHCVLRWGSQFRPEYAQLGCLKEIFPAAPVIALTGTLLPENQMQVSEALQLHAPEVVRESVNRPNIRLQISQKRRAKQQLLSFLMKDGMAQPGIIYCRARNKTEELAHWLNEQGITASCYHASLSAAERDQAHSNFAKGAVQVMVATTAYGMGVDLEHVRFVVHMDLPLSLENYAQEIGRAGRDGRPAQALLFYGLQDILQTWQFVRQEQLEDEFWRLMDCLEHAVCRRRALLSAFSETAEQDCGNCDRCLQQSKQHNVTVAAQKLLSLVYHTKGGVPFSALINCLLGKRIKSVTNFALEQHPLFGQGKALDETQWKAVIRLLLAKGYLLQQSVVPFAVALAEKSRRVLRAEEQLIITSDWFYPALKDADMSQYSQGGWHQLLHWSVSNRVSDHLSDVQLHKVFEAKPSSLASLSRITGLSKELLTSLNAESLFASPNLAKESYD